jgi:RNA-binding protein
MDTAHKKQLKMQAHDLKPVVIIGQAGLTDAVLTEIDIALDYHELIKVKIRNIG